MPDPTQGPQHIIFTPEELAKWTPVRRGNAAAPETPPPDTGAIGSVLGTAGHVGIGAAKGVDQSAVNAGGLVSAIPGVGSITNALGNIVGEGAARLRYGKDATGGYPASNEAAFADVNKSLEPQGAAEKVGKFAEQVGEFFLPADAAQKLAIKGLVRLIPDAASPGMMKVLNKAGALIGRTAGEAASAGGVSALHGDRNVDTEATIAGAGPLGGSAVQSLLASPTVQHVLSLIIAGMPASLVPGGLAGRMGTFGMLRKGVQSGLEHPAVQRAAGTGTKQLGRLGAGISSETR